MGLWGIKYSDADEKWWVDIVLQDAPLHALALQGLELTPLDVDAGGAQFDLTLNMQEAAGELSGKFSYATDLFGEATIARMAAHFISLLQGMIAEPRQSVWELPLLTAAEEIFRNSARRAAITVSPSSPSSRIAFSRSSAAIVAIFVTLTEVCLYDNIECKC